MKPRAIGPDERDMILAALRNTTSTPEDIAIMHGRSVEVVYRLALANKIPMRELRASWQGVIDRLDGLSRLRALTDAESRLLERAIKEAAKPKRKATPGDLTKPEARASIVWSPDMENTLCDLVADGMTISDAARRMGLPTNATQRRFAIIRERMGAQAA